MNKTAVNEEMHPEKEWFADAEKQTLESLPDFINHVMNDYIHDYGTVVHAVAACAIAAAWAANEADGARGGITGFQAGFVMWDFVLQWQFKNNKSGLRILDFDKLLYPQYSDRFEKVIDPKQWEKLQELARNNLEDRDACDEVREHWASIVDGKVPFGFRVKEVDF